MEQSTATQIAIVGIGCRMPGGIDSPEAFWDALVSKKDVVGEVPPERWSLDSFYDPDRSNHTKMATRRGGFVHNIDKFDNTFFKISPREASSMDPQQRHILEVTYEAFQDAGIIPTSLGESCGVFMGVGMSDYKVMLADESVTGPYTITGTGRSPIANRVSYAFDLRGPSLTVDTACASSTTALHLGCNAILNGECTHAVAGGCNATLIPETTIGLNALGVLSPEGKCCPFSDKANGYVRSEGFGTLILKNLDAAIADNDHIYATIIGTSIAANGFSTSLSMPSGQAQEMVIQNTHKRYVVPTSSVKYVEAHGTGTPVGDPIEAHAVGHVFGQSNNPIKIGSVKSNFGHSESAAGITASIKVALMLDKNTLAPTINHERPNPMIDLQKLNLQVQTTTETIEDDVYTIGLNSFGFSGAVAYAIFQKAPRQVKKREARLANWKFGKNEGTGTTVIIPFSAKSKQALIAIAEKWSEFQSDEDALSVVSWQATRREHHPYRLAVIANSSSSFLESLQDFIQGRPSVVGTAQQAKPKICFVFPGQGQQWVDMGRNLYKHYTVFRATIHDCDSIFKSISGWSLLECCGLFTGEDIDTHKSLYSSVEDALQHVEVVQPAITFIQVALLHLWRDFGVQPDVVVGHSVGEIAASYACGGLTLKEALSVIFHRSHQQATLKGAGKMAVLRATKEQALKICEDYNHLHIAAVNAPGLITLAGNNDVITDVVEHNPGKAKLLRVSCAFHTPEMDPIEEPFNAAMKGVIKGDTSHRDMPYYSTVTGKHYDGTFTTDYWWRNIRSAVLFQSAIEAVLEETKSDIFLEIAASNTLLTPVKQIAYALDPKNPPFIINSSLREKDDLNTLLRAIGSLYGIGVSLDWAKITHNAAEWSPIPTYPWQHQSFWLETEDRQKHRLGLDDRTFKGQNGKLSFEVFPFLADHVVGNRVVFPGAGFVEFMMQMGFKDSEKPALKNVNFTRVLPWPEKTNLKKCSLKLELNRDGDLMQVMCDTNLHSDARINSIPSETGALFLPLDEIRERCTTEISSDVFYSSLENVGLNYGPAFQNVEKMLLGDGEALAILTTVPDNKQRVQVAHFDAALQLVLSAVGPVTSMYLPTHIDSMHMTKEAIPIGQQIVAYTRILDHDTTFITADLAMLTTEGEVLVDIKGFLGQNVSGNKSDVSIESCVYTTHWQPLLACTQPTSIISDMFQVDKLEEGYDSELNAITRAEEVFHILERLCASYIQNAISVVPHEKQNNEITKYVNRLEAISANAKPVPFSNISEVTSNLINKVPEIETELNLLNRFGESLPETLQDPKVGFAIMYPDEGTDRYFYDSLSTRMCYKATSQAIVQAISETAKSKKVVRVLGLGDIGGSLTGMVLSSLSDEGLLDHIEYVFTSTTKRFTQEAKKNLGEYTCIEYKHLDINRNIKDQDIVPGSFDVALCIHTLHASDNCQQSTSYVSDLVSPDGLLFVIECTNMQFLANFFSLATDDETKCLLSRQGWIDTMTSVGLEDVVSASSPTEFIQTVFVGRKPSVSSGIAPCNKLLVIQSDKEVFSSNISSWYEGNTEIVNFSEAHSLHDLLNGQTTSPLEVLYIYNDDDSNVHCLLRLFQAVESYPQAVKRLWVLTTGGNKDCTDPSGSLAIGLTRAVANQVPNVPIFSVDFDPTSTNEEKVVQLIKLMNDSNLAQQEITIRKGETYVPRLVHQDLHLAKAVHSKYWRVEQDLRSSRGKGASIDDLAFHDINDLQLLPGYVKIAVKSAPLNFKDVMMSLGLLEGLESDVHPSFGLECSGEVVQVGEGVTGLKVNDKVMAFGKSCFASHAVCQSKLTVRKPDNLNWVNSSSVGVIFVTAYLSLVERANLKKDETVLIHSACGGVGLAAIQIARMRGVKIICTAGTEEKRSYLRQELDIEMVSNSRSSRFYDDVMKWTDGKGVDVVLNSLSGKLLQTGLSLLAPGGRFCEIGKRDILQSSSLPMNIFLENKVFHSCQLDILMKQQPEKVQEVMHKVVALFEDKTLEPIPTSVYSIANLKDTFRAMSKGSHIGKIVFEIPDDFHPSDLHPALCQFKANATYIVTGGYGGIGQALARWLCVNGAKHIALVSRRGATTGAAKRMINFLKKNNVTVYEFSLDISNKASIETLLLKIKEDEKAPPIKGIFHLAGVIEEENLSEITPEQMNRIVRAKALGAQYLNELTQQDSVDVFFMLSSTSTALGHHAQPCYCAANAYLDALAHKRHTDGLPALSVQLGPVKGAGYLEDKGQTVKVLARKGWNQVYLDDFLFLLNQLLPLQDLPVVNFSITNWAIYQKFLHKSMLKFHHLVIRSKATSTKKDPLEITNLETSIKSKMAQLLCMTEDAIDIDQPMVNYGVDSLVALEIANWATNQLGVEVSQFDILGGMSTVTLVNKAAEANDKRDCRFE